MSFDDSRADDSQNDFSLYLRLLRLFLLLLLVFLLLPLSWWLRPPALILSVGAKQVGWKWGWRYFFGAKLVGWKWDWIAGRHRLVL